MKHVFLDHNYDQGHILMKDLENQKDCIVIYRDRMHKSKLISSQYCHLLFGKLKNRTKALEKLIWKTFLRQHIDTDTQTIAMVTSWYTNTLLGLIKEMFPQAKLILLMRDTVMSNTQRNKEFKIEEAKRIFDLILSYDNIYDVPTYGLTYAPVYMSKSDDTPAVKCKYDISFIAEAKDRAGMVNGLYRKFAANDINSYLYLCHVRKSDRLNPSTIIYADKFLKRNEMLRRELEANCILEVLKGDAHSCTLRFWEAVMYNKKFYTNWKGVVNSPYYNPKYIKVFEKPDDIDLDFIRERLDVDYNYQGELSPIHLLNRIRQL